MRERLARIPPAQLVALAFAVLVLAGTALLMLPWATAAPGGAPFMTALVTATSAVCVTGLAVVDTPAYWSTTGQVTIMLLVQVGGFGVIATTTLLTLLIARRLNLRSRLVAEAESGVRGSGSVRRVLVGVAAVSLVVEALTAAVFAARLLVAYDDGAGSAAWRGVFHAVMAFNQAGFALWSDSLTRFVTDPWISLSVCFAVVIGGLGAPVWLELAREYGSPRTWSLHTKLTLWATAFLLVLGVAAFALFEWTNPRTLGPLDTPGKLVASVFGGVQPRSAGFNSLDYDRMEPETLLLTDMLMFIGTGSASTGGGIKVTTFAVLALMVVAELRGEPVVHVLGRRVPQAGQRQALAVAFLALNAVVLATLGLMATSGLGLEPTLFEALSAFGTVGLSTGITADLDWRGEAILVALMFVGRVGPQTLGVALVLRESQIRYRYPEERPVIG